MATQNPLFTQSFEKVQLLTLPASYAGQRLDNFLFTQLKGLPKSRIYRLLRKGELRVNKKRVKPDYRLVESDIVRLPPIRLEVQDEKTLNIPPWVQKALKTPLHEDDDLLVINKPSGLAVHGGTSIDFGVIEALRALRPELEYIELVHRLDRTTSGVLLLAKNRAVLNALHDQFRREVGDDLKKAYLAVVSTKTTVEAQTITAKLTQARDAQQMKRVVVSEEGRMAKTDLQPLLAHKGFALIRLHLHTGRMHQARVHAAHVGCPIVGDEFYGLWPVNKAVRSLGIKRCCLHAESYTFKHPTTGRSFKVIAPLPDDLTSALNVLDIGVDYV